MDPLTLTIGAIFALIFLWALVTWSRRRDPLSLDVLLVFTAMGAIFVLSLFRILVGTPPPILSGAAIVLLLGQPVFTLRLTARIHPIPKALLPVALIGWLVTAIPLAVAGAQLDKLLVLAAVGVFVAIEATAAVYLAVAARRRSGSGAIRLWIAALATGLFAFAILASGSGAAASGSREIGRVLAQIAALLAALGYLMAFVPPGVLRRAWQAQAAYSGLRALLASSSGRQDEVWRCFLSIARASTDARAGLIIEAAPPVGRRITMVDGLPSAIIGELAPASAPLPEGDIMIGGVAAIDGFGPVAEAARALGVHVVQMVALGPDPEAPRLVLLSSHHSLFGEDDRLLLAALGQQAAGLVEQRRLADELATTAEALRSASQAKSDFLASMSHELRTPLNAILGFSDLMRNGQLDADGNTLVPLEWVEHIHRGGTHLVELVNDVLDLSKVEAGRLDLDREPIEVLPAVAETVAGLRPLADRKGQTIKLDISAHEHVSADRGRLRQIVYNLLSNAIKFTPEGGRITIEGRVRGTEFHLGVSDTGIGIAPDDQAAVFEEFRQVGTGAQRTEGTGLGLALTRRLVEAHDGRLELESTPGVGSRFTVVLPGASPDPRTDGAPAPEPGSTPGQDIPGAAVASGTVLIVEDDPSAVRLLRAYLEPEGYQVRVVSDGEQALEIARSQPPMAILLDVLLPGIDGWETLRRLKADPNLRDVPVVIVTVVDERDVGLALGAVDYLVKPIDRDALLASLGRLNLTAKGQTRKVRVLIVDDEDASLDILEETLVPAGFEVVRADGGKAGVDLARHHRPDLIICDLVMPDLDGFGVVGALKADPLTADTPVIILTAHELTAADKSRLNGMVLGIVTKGPDAQAGLRSWLAHAQPSTGP